MKYVKRGNESSIKEVCCRNLGASSHDELNQWFITSRENGYWINGITADGKTVSLKDVRDAILAYKDKPIIIVGDYDCDGMTSTEILLEAFEKGGCKNVHYMFSYRHTEGYGINERIVDEIKEKFGKDICLVTVDNGIAAISALDKAKNVHGFSQIIVIDHHLGKPAETELGIELPAADIIVDPAALPDTAKFSRYCGAGLSYKLAIEFLGKDALILKSLAAVATIADVMPLREENYVIVREGLKSLSDGFAVPGLKAICDVNDLHVITAENVGFTIAPIINSAGRLFPNGGYKAMDCLHADRYHAEYFARMMTDWNSKRKDLVKEALKKCDNDYSDKDVIIINLEDVNSGIVGIIAGHLCEKWNRPAIVFTSSEGNPDLYAGSARSIDGINIKAVLDKISEHIHHYGGHEGAAGVSIEKNKYDVFKSFVENEIATIDKSVFRKPDEYFYDLQIEASEVSKTIEAIQKYEPFGEGNPAPVFKIVNFESIPYAGNYKSEIAGGGIRLKGKSATAVGFGMADDMKDATGAKVTLYGTVAFNRFRNSVTPQIQFNAFEEE